MCSLFIFQRKHSQGKCTGPWNYSVLTFCKLHIVYWYRNCESLNLFQVQGGSLSKSLTMTKLELDLLFSHSGIHSLKSWNWKFLIFSKFKKIKFKSTDKNQIWNWLVFSGKIHAHPISTLYKHFHKCKRAELKISFFPTFKRDNFVQNYRWPNSNLICLFLWCIYMSNLSWMCTTFGETINGNWKWWNDETTEWMSEEIMNKEAQ
jgi:hypothetical protein